MTTPPQVPADEAPLSADEDDHDLLTYGIAGDRLREEIAAEKDRLAVAITDYGIDSEPARVALARRDQLQAGLERQQDARRNKINEKQFFGEHFESRPMPS
jgi:hypothetical protein